MPKLKGGSDPDINYLGGVINDYLIFLLSGV